MTKSGIVSDFHPIDQVCRTSLEIYDISQKKKTYKGTFDSGNKFSLIVGNTNTLEKIHLPMPRGRTADAGSLYFIF